MRTFSNLVAMLFLGCALGSLLGIRELGIGTFPAWYQTIGDKIFLTELTLYVLWIIMMKSKAMYMELMALAMVYCMPVVIFIMAGMPAEANNPELDSFMVNFSAVAMIAMPILLFIISISQSKSKSDEADAGYKSFSYSDYLRSTKTK